MAAPAVSLSSGTGVGDDYFPTNSVSYLNGYGMRHQEDDNGEAITLTNSP